MNFLNVIELVLTKIGAAEMLKFLVSSRFMNVQSSADRPKVDGQFLAENVCDIIIKARPNFCDSNGSNVLRVSDLSNSQDNGIIYINKCYPKSTYKILSEARTRKRDANSDHLYVKNGIVRAKRGDNSDDIILVTSSDLHALMTS